MPVREAGQDSATERGPTERGDDEDRARLRLWLRMLKSTRGVEAVLRDRLRTQFGSTLPRFDVMAALARHGTGLKMSALSGVLKVSNGNVTGIIDRLAEDGLVVRVQVPGDRRASLVRLTRKGQEEFARQAGAHRVWVSDLLADFSPEEARALTDRFDEVNARKDGS